VFNRTKVVYLDRDAKKNVMNKEQRAKSKEQRAKSQGPRTKNKD